MSAPEANFSIGLRLGDLDDYIQPSQECVKPVQQKPQGAAGAPAASAEEKRAKIELAEDGAAVEVDDAGRRTALQAATVTLNDCLACSGCITSAESVLVTAQSTAQFGALAAAARARGAPLAASVAPESLAALAAAHGLPLFGAFRRVVALFASLGASLVADTAFARDALSAAAARELCDRVRRRQPQLLPMLASECPGWVCYAEKTHAADVLPRLCRCRSAMALTGALLKRRLGRGDAVHASVAPCFDKKLEAVREDVRGAVDCVLATSELLELLPPGVASFAELPEADDATMRRLCAFANVDWDRNELFWSGIDGPLMHIARVAAHELLGASGDPAIKVVRGRNADAQEMVVTAAAAGGSGGELRFATAYGFRNIQNVVRRIKQGRYAPQFVEVMACPQSCVNGGGQLRPPKGRDPKEWVEGVRKVLETRRVVRPEDNAEAMALLDDHDLQLTAEFKTRESKAAAPMQIQW